MVSTSDRSHQVAFLLLKGKLDEVFKSINIEVTVLLPSCTHSTEAIMKGITPYVRTDCDLFFNQLTQK